MTAPKHSLLPWSDDGFGIVDSNGQGVTVYGFKGAENSNANRLLIIAAVNSHTELRVLKNRIDIRLNDYLCEMKPGYDDSMTGFTEAWDIVRDFFAEIEAAAAAEEPAL
jgi:hypothetical protein